MHHSEPSFSSLRMTMTCSLLSLMLVGVYSISAQDAEWEIECVDCPKLFESFTDHCFCIDTDGRPHVAYGRDHLYYARHNGESWQYETVDEAPLVGIHASMALDADGHPHISYFDDLNDDLKYACRDDGGWQLTTVDPGVGGYHITCSIGVDPEGLPHISYHSYSPSYALKYAHFDGANWLIETVDPHGVASDYNSLSIDAFGHPHISYIAGGPNYAYRDENGWDIENVGVASAGYTSLRVDKNGVPHISFGHSGIHYATRNGTSWIVETVDTEGEHVSLIVDTLNHPHMSYCVGTELRYAARGDSSWSVSSADSDWGSVERSSLALDDSAHPHIVHKRQGELRVARYNEVGWTSEKIDEDGSVGQYNSLALDEFDHPHVGYHDDRNNDLKYATRGPLGWELQTVEEQGKVGEHTSIAISPEGLPHISYTKTIAGWRNVLRYAFHDDTSWHVEPVDDQSGLHQIGRYNSLQIDESGNAHVSYHDSDIYSNDSSLKYGFRDDAGWHLHVVDQDNCGAFTSIALDQNTRPHISYFGYPDLRYAFWGGSEWQVETVSAPEDPELETGVHTSLVLDGVGNAYMGHVFDWWAGPPDIGFGVRVAYDSGTEWKIDDIEEWIGCETTASIALDHLGRPHIVYWHATYEDYTLRLAWFDGGNWRVESITQGNPSLDLDRASLAIDSDGNRHVTYYDRLLQDLLYAFSPAPAGSQNPDQVSPSTLSLNISGPCPTSGGVSLVLGLPSEARAQLMIYDVLGRRVHLLGDVILSQGEHLVTWDGSSAHNDRVPSGTYILFAEAGGQRVSERVVLIR